MRGQGGAQALATLAGLVSVCSRSGFRESEPWPGEPLMHQEVPTPRSILTTGQGPGVAQWRCQATPVQPRGTPIVKTAREQLDILTTYQELGSYRAAAALCGTTHKTVRRVVERRARPAAERPARPKVTDPVLDSSPRKVERAPMAVSAPSVCCRCVAPRAIRYRPARSGGPWPSPRPNIAGLAARIDPGSPCLASDLVFDWGEQDGMQVFCAVLAWSRWRFVRFAGDQDQATTLHLLAECFGAWWRARGPASPTAWAA